MKILVTGGSGFLGSHIVTQLLAISNGESLASTDLGALENCTVRVLDIIGELTHLEEPVLQKYKDQVEIIEGSVLNRDIVSQAVKGCDAVIHCASVVDYERNDEDVMYSVNVHGTEIVLEACKKNDVRIFVYTSTSEVVLGPNGCDGLNERSASYISEDDNISLFLKTKIEAEKVVLKENSTATAGGIEFITSIVRPVGLYGPGDEFHLKETIRIGRDLGNSNMFRFGDGKSVRQMAYVGNVAYLHLCIIQKMYERDEKVSGQIFFGIDNTKVRNYFDFMRTFEAHMGYKIPEVSIPKSLLFAFSAGNDAYKKVIGAIFPSAKDSSSMSQSVQSLVVTNWFKTEKAKKLVDYKPIYTPMEARELSKAYLDSLAAEGFDKGDNNYGNKYEYDDESDLYYPDEYVDANYEEISKEEFENLISNKFYYDDFTETYYSDEEYDRTLDFEDLDEEIGNMPV